jgi:phosphatidylserine decarboxylase
MGWLTHCNWSWLKNYLIYLFINRYKVNMQDAIISNPYEHKNFNDFFTRALKKESRPLPSDNTIAISPVDGIIIEHCSVHYNTIIQVKGQKYNAHQLLGGKQERTALFEGGDLISFYLAPKDYHRVHMPIAGILREMVYIPGKLFSVNPITTQHIPDVLARNERVISIFDTEVGPMALILVGAMLVASIETVWASIVAPSTSRKKGIQTWYYNQESAIQPTLQRGEEMGRFQFGSTVVVIFGPQVLRIEKNIQANESVIMGQALGTVSSSPVKKAAKIE